jgi:hypothetical protein
VIQRGPVVWLAYLTLCAPKAGAGRSKTYRPQKALCDCRDLVPSSKRIYCLYLKYVSQYSFCQPHSYPRKNLLRLQLGNAFIISRPPQSLIQKSIEGSIPVWTARRGRVSMPAAWIPLGSLSHRQDQKCLVVLGFGPKGFTPKSPFIYAAEFEGAWPPEGHPPLASKGEGVADSLTQGGLVSEYW